MSLIRKVIMNPRLWLIFCAFALAALCLVVALLAPQQGPLLLYKIALVLLGALALYLFDRIFYWFADPGGYLKDDWRNTVDADHYNAADYPVVVGCEKLFIAAQFRRAILIAVGMLATAWGL